MGALHDKAVDEFRSLLGDRFTTSPSVTDLHGRDESAFPPASPDGVAFPSTTGEVSSILEVCSRFEIPAIPFGVGTSLEGNVLATSGGLTIDLSQMNRIPRVSVSDLDVTVEAGVTRSALNERLASDGLFFPVDPGADATIGGMAATGASGTTTVRYGAMRENVLALKVVLADGRVIDTARRARKSAAGYDLTRLFVGSEGTLGVITEVCLRTYGIPEAISGAVCHFSDIDSAVRSVIAILQLGIPVARIEFLDEVSVRAINNHSGLSMPVAPLLLLEFHGSVTGVVEQSAAVHALAEEFGAIGFRSSGDHKERADLWRARHDHYHSSLALRPGSRSITTDVCVPISALAECIVETRRDVDSSGLTATIAGHVGDGNFHVMMLVDPEDPTEMSRAEAVNERLVERALTMDGTCTGEHGIGLHKMGFLEKELPEGVEVMRSIKRALDPHNIMNPGKVLRP